MTLLILWDIIENKRHFWFYVSALQHPLLVCNSSNMWYRFHFIFQCLTSTPHTSDEGVALDILGQTQCRPPQGPARGLFQQVVDVLVVDFTEWNPNRKLSVWFQVQADVLLCSHSQHGVCKVEHTGMVLHLSITWFTANLRGHKCWQCKYVVITNITSN